MNEKLSTIIEDDPNYAWDESKHCRHPQHNPPRHICIPGGKRLRHKCPACGKEQIIYNSSPILKF